MRTLRLRGWSTEVSSHSPGLHLSVPPWPELWVFFPARCLPIDAWILLTWYRSDCAEDICTCSHDILDSRWKEFLAAVGSPEPKNQLSWLAFLFSFYVNIYGMFYHVCVQHMWVGTHQSQRHWVVVSHLVEVLGIKFGSSKSNTCC